MPVNPTTTSGTTRNTDPESLSGQMLDRVTASGELTPGWSGAFAALARHRFISDTIWITDRDGLVPLHRREDPWNGCDAPTPPPQ